MINSQPFEQKSVKHSTLLKILVFLFPMSMMIKNVQLTALQLTLPTILGTAILILILIERLADQEKSSHMSKKWVVAIFLGLLGLILLLSNALNGSLSDAIQKALSFLRLIIYFLAMFFYIQTVDDLKFVGKTFFLTGVLIGITVALAGLNLAHFQFGRVGSSRFQSMEIDRASGILGSFGENTVYFSWMLAATLNKLFVKKHSSFAGILLILLTGGSIGTGLLFAQSRNTLLTCLVVVIAYIIITRSENERGPSLTISLIAFAGFFGLIVVMLWMDKINDYLHYFFIDLGGQRISQVQVFFQTIKGHWIFGNGMGSFQALGIYRYDIHNALLQITNWGGVVALALFMFIWIYPSGSMISSLKGNPPSAEQRKVTNLYWVMLIGLFTTAQFFTALNSSVVFIMWGVISAIPFLKPASEPETIEEKETAGVPGQSFKSVIPFS